MRKVLFGGSFDILHGNHLDILKIAKTFGDYLVVAIANDGRIRGKKHPALPIFEAEERKKLIEHLDMVDEAYVIYDKPENNVIFKALKLIQPDVYVRTEEVNPIDEKAERKLCKELGIEMKIIPRFSHPNFKSSSKIIKYILENFKLEDMNKLIKKDE